MLDQERLHVGQLLQQRLSVARDLTKSTRLTLPSAIVQIGVEVAVERAVEAADVVAKRLEPR